MRCVRKCRNRGLRNRSRGHQQIIQRKVRRKHSPLRGAAEIGMAVGAVLDAGKMATHFAVEAGMAISPGGAERTGSKRKPGSTPPEAGAARPSPKPNR